MAFSDDLEAKIAEIREAALDLYVTYSRIDFGHHDFNDDRTRVAGPYSSAGGEELQAMLDEFNAELDGLLQRFARYASLQSWRLRAVRSRLSRLDPTALGGGWAGALGITEQWPRSVVDRIDYAGALVFQISHLETLHSEGIWRGPAADAFNDEFLVPFAHAAARQVFCGIYLANVAIIFLNVVDQTKRDVMDIAEACRAAFREEAPAPRSEQLSELSVGLDLIGFFLPPPLDLLAGVGSIQLDATADRARQREPDLPDWHVDNGRPWPVVRSTNELLDRLEARLAERDAEIYADLTSDVSTYFYSADFETRPERPHPPDVIDEELVVNIETIYEYGARVFPTAAAQYAAARAELEECVTPEWFAELLLPRSASEFTVARSGLRPALVKAHDYLADAGSTLVTSCNEYQWADEAGAAEFAEFTRGVPPPQPADQPVRPRPPKHVF